MSSPTRVELSFGPIAYVKPSGARRPRTLDELEAETGEPIDVVWRERMRAAGLAYDEAGVDVIRWPDGAAPPDVGVDGAGRAKAIDLDVAAYVRDYTDRRPDPSDGGEVVPPPGAGEHPVDLVMELVAEYGRRIQLPVLTTGGPGADEVLARIAEAVKALSARGDLPY
ncbi:hypothetical protein [Nocardioides sp.]|uniref:hypothetical protein n=1 Tax=Nocardioides sp. TaxID=35761 RepID=UPI002C00CBD2|nr:hypothetical protein [Nocardioides sp.]HXH79534.1 hypothetical protein [Nocardioides sp.]